MISFREFLTESQNYPLYHGTTMIDLANIIIKNEIKTGYPDRESHWPSKDGSIISTTRSYNFAKEWSLERSPGKWIVIELDRSKLKNNYKIVPFNYFGTDFNTDKPQARWLPNKRYVIGGDVDRNQFEESITKNIKPALKYINKVHMSNVGKDIFKRDHGNEYSVLMRHNLI